MSNYVYADQATKGIVKASPTIDKDGLVRKWDVQVVYSLNGFKSTFEDDIHAGEFTPKVPSEFTKSELLALCPTVRWDMVFDSQYQSVVLAESKESKDSSFDVHSLGD